MTVILHTNLGDIRIELDHENTPNSAASFEKYVKDGFYDGTIFHRVIDGFMVQGGGMTEDMSPKNTNAPIENEADKGGENVRGSVALARTNDPHSATSQFFINVTDNAFLNHKSKDPHGWGYCVFGRVVEGMDVVDKIKAQDTTYRLGHDDVPVHPITIEKAELAEDNN